MHKYGYFCFFIYLCIFQTPASASQYIYPKDAKELKQIEEFVSLNVSYLGGVGDGLDDIDTHISLTKYLKNKYSESFGSIPFKELSQNRLEELKKDNMNAKKKGLIDIHIMVRAYNEATIAVHIESVMGSFQNSKKIGTYEPHKAWKATHLFVCDKNNLLRVIKIAIDEVVEPMAKDLFMIKAHK